jgi:hypothetical protein
MAVSVVGAVVLGVPMPVSVDGPAELMSVSVVAAVGLTCHVVSVAGPMCHVVPMSTVSPVLLSVVLMLPVVLSIVLMVPPVVLSVVLPIVVVREPASSAEPIAVMRLVLMNVARGVATLMWVQQAPTRLELGGGGWARRQAAHQGRAVRVALGWRAGLPRPARLLKTRHWSSRAGTMRSCRCGVTACVLAASALLSDVAEQAAALALALRALECQMCGLATDVAQRIAVRVLVALATGHGRAGPADGCGRRRWCRLVVRRTVCRRDSMHRRVQLRLGELAFQSSQARVNGVRGVRAAGDGGVGELAGGDEHVAEGRRYVVHIQDSLARRLVEAPKKVFDHVFFCHVRVHLDAQVPHACGVLGDRHRSTFQRVQLATRVRGGVGGSEDFDKRRQRLLDGGAVGLAQHCVERGQGEGVQRPDEDDCRFLVVHFGGSDGGADCVGPFSDVLVVGGAVRWAANATGEHDIRRCRCRCRCGTCGGRCGGVKAAARDDCCG